MQFSFAAFLAAPDPPIITSVTSTFYDRLTITWRNVGYTNYSVSINDSNATNVLLGYKTDPHPDTYTFTGLENNTAYNISVVAINCIGNSSAASITGKTCELNMILIFMHVLEDFSQCMHCTCKVNQ